MLCCRSIKALDNFPCLASRLPTHNHLGVPPFRPPEQKLPSCAMWLECTCWPCVGILFECCIRYLEPKAAEELGHSARTDNSAAGSDPKQLTFAEVVAFMQRLLAQGYNVLITQQSGRLVGLLLDSFTRVGTRALEAAAAAGASTVLHPRGLEQDVWRIVYFIF
jgi:hypothetical protein